MRPLAATPASAADDRAPVPLWTIDDLQDADLDLVLADRLAESAVALRAAAATAERSLRGAPGHLLAG
ncbi:hypothetical protein [Blastococcus sp. SYSU DS0617]